MYPYYTELWQWFEECYDQLKHYKIKPNDEVDYWIKWNYGKAGETPLSTAVMIHHKFKK